MTKIKFELDGQQVEANAGETIWQVAKRHQKEIPHLCYSPAPDYRPDGNCRACMVEIEGFGGTVVLHCFSEPDLLPVALERGYSLSFAGNVTFPKAGDLREAAARVPADRI